MDYNVVSGNIQPYYQYIVGGGQSVTYNTVTYSTGQVFIGVQGVNSFIYSGTGTQLLYQVTNFKGAAIEIIPNLSEANTRIYPDKTAINGFALEFKLNHAEELVPDETALKGFAMELIDYPFFSYEITETRL